MHHNTAAPYVLFHRFLDTVQCHNVFWKHDRDDFKSDFSKKQKKAVVDTGQKEQQNLRLAAVYQVVKETEKTKFVALLIGELEHCRGVHWTQKALFHENTKALAFQFLPCSPFLGSFHLTLIVEAYLSAEPELCRTEGFIARDIKLKQKLF